MHVQNIFQNSFVKGKKNSFGNTNLIVTRTQPTSNQGWGDTGLGSYQEQTHHGRQKYIALAPITIWYLNSSKRSPGRVHLHTHLLNTQVEACTKNQICRSLYYLMLKQSSKQNRNYKNNNINKVIWAHKKNK